MKNLSLIILFLFFLTANAQNDVDSVRRRGWRPRFNAEYPDVHDPVMAFEDGKYYIFSTGMGISVMSSTDLKTWYQEKPVFPTPLDWAVNVVPGYKGHTWAPDVIKVGNLWYLYYSCSSFGKNNSSIGVACNRTLNTSSPDYKWQDLGEVIRSIPRVTPWNAIDPNICQDEHGDYWMTFGSFWDGIQLVKLEKDMKTPVGKPVTIARNLNPEAMSKKAGNSNDIEAPFIVYNNGYYYLFASTGLCCKGLQSTYRTVVGRSKKITGPYKNVKGKKMLSGASSLLIGKTDQYVGVGHCSVYNYDDKWFYVAHGYDKNLNGASKLVVKPIMWIKGWPIISD